MEEKNSSSHPSAGGRGEKAASERVRPALGSLPLLTPKIRLHRQQAKPLGDAGKSNEMAPRRGLSFSASILCSVDPGESLRLTKPQPVSASHLRNQQQKPRDQILGEREARALYRADPELTQRTIATGQATQGAIVAVRQTRSGGSVALAITPLAMSVGDVADGQVSVGREPSEDD